MSRYFALLLFSCGCAHATTYWVTNDGAGAKDGSDLANACQLWSDTDCTPSPGDMVCLSGEFTANAQLTVTVGGVIYDGACQGASPAILNRQGSGGSRLSASGNVDEVIIRDIEIKGASGAHAVLLTGGDTDKWVFDSLYIHDNPGVLGLRADGSELEVKNSRLADNGAGGMTLSGPRLKIHDNELTDNGGVHSNTDGIGLLDGSEGSVVYLNKIYRQKSSQGASIDIGGDNTDGVIDVFANRIYESAGNGIMLSADQLTVRAMGNLLVDNLVQIHAKGNGTQIISNNTAISTSSITYHFRCGNSAEGTGVMRYINNIFYGPADRVGYVNNIGAQCEDENNLYPANAAFLIQGSCDPCTVAQWQAVYGDSSVLGTPAFVDTNDYELAVGSVGLDNGAYITVRGDLRGGRCAGGLQDIGAYCNDTFIPHGYTLMPKHSNRR